MLQTGVIRPFPYTLVTGVLELIAPGVYATPLAVVYRTNAVDGVLKIAIFSLREGVNGVPYYQFLCKKPSTWLSLTRFIGLDSWAVSFNFRFPFPTFASSNFTGTWISLL